MFDTLEAFIFLPKIKKQIKKNWKIIKRTNAKIVVYMNRVVWCIPL